MLTFIIPKSTKNFSLSTFLLKNKEIYRVPVTNLVVFGSKDIYLFKMALYILVVSKRFLFISGKN
jgi:hypothetical protein